MKPAATRSRTPEPPFCWQSKEALRLIRRYMEDKDQWLKISSRLVFYLALCEMASNKGSESFVCSQKSLKDLCGLSEHTQTEIIRDLESAGVITACSPPNGMQGQKRYTLLSRSEVGSARSELHGVGVLSSDVRRTIERTGERTKEEHPPTSLDCVECVGDSHPGGNGSEEGNIPVAVKAAGGEAPRARGRAREKPAAGVRADDAAFAEFWQVYPRKVGKRDAERAWIKLRPPWSKVLAALEAWRNSPEWLKDGGRYIPHPATWLNRGGWEDELPAVRQQPESFI